MFQKINRLYITVSPLKMDPHWAHGQTLHSVLGFLKSSVHIQPNHPIPFHYSSPWCCDFEIFSIQKTYIISSHFLLVRLYIISSLLQNFRSFIYNGLCFSLNLLIPQASFNFQTIQEKQLLTLLLKSFRGDHTDMQAYYFKSVIDTVPKYVKWFLNLVQYRTSVVLWFGDQFLLVSTILFSRLFIIYMWEKVQFYFVG